MYNDDQRVSPCAGELCRLDDTRSVARPVVYDEEQDARRLLRLVLLSNELRGPVRHLLQQQEKRERDYFSRNGIRVSISEKCEGESDRKTDQHQPVQLWI